MLSVFTSPSRYTQGKGATAALGQEMAALGLEGPVLVMAGKTVIGLLEETWKRSLDEAGLKHAVYRFGGECSLGEIERVKTAAREVKARTIVGAGGGKVLDTARAAAAGLDLPVVNCPTVASSDAPCSALIGDLHRRRPVSGVPLLPQESRSGPGRYRGHRSGAAAALGRGHGRCAGDLVRGQDVRCGSREEHARRGIDAQRGGTGRALLQDPTGRRSGGTPGRGVQGRDAGARATG